MNKKNLLIISICFSILCSFSCKKTEKNLIIDDISLANILVKEKIVVGIDSKHPPLSFINSKGQIIGFDIDILKAVAEDIDIDIEFIPIKWKDKLKIISNDEIDCLAGGFSAIETRKSLYEMTNPYFRNAQIILVLNKTSYKTIKDLKGKAIGGQRDSVGLNAIRNTPKLRDNFKISKSYPTVLNAISDLKNRGIEAAIADISVITDILNKNSGVFRVLEEPLAIDFYAYAFKKGNVSLKNEIEKTMLKLEQNGTLEKISRKWFKSDVIILGK